MPRVMITMVYRIRVIALTALLTVIAQTTAVQALSLPSPAAGILDAAARASIRAENQANWSSVRARNKAVVSSARAAGTLSSVHAQVQANVSSTKVTNRAARAAALRILRTRSSAAAQASLKAKNAGKRQSVSTRRQ